MFKEIEIRIDKKVYYITQANYKTFKEILKEFKQFVSVCLSDEIKKLRCKK